MLNTFTKASLIGYMISNIQSKMLLQFILNYMFGLFGSFRCNSRKITWLSTSLVSLHELKGIVNFRGSLPAYLLVFNLLFSFFLKNLQNMSGTDLDRPPYTPFFGAMGATAAMAFSGKLQKGLMTTGSRFFSMHNHYHTDWFLLKPTDDASFIVFKELVLFQISDLRDFL